MWLEVVPKGGSDQHIPLFGANLRAATVAHGDRAMNGRSSKGQMEQSSQSNLLFRDHSGSLELGEPNLVYFLAP